MMGYGDTLLITNVSPIVWQIIILLILGLVAVMFKNFCKCMQKLNKALFWNIFIRFFMETYFELLFTSTMNVTYRR